MEAILEYIVLNYTWFLGGAIVILLAIIGSYADKTNFGQGKTEEPKEKTSKILDSQEIEKEYEKNILNKTTEEVQNSEIEEANIQLQNESSEKTETKSEMDSSNILNDTDILIEKAQEDVNKVEFNSEEKKSNNQIEKEEIKPQEKKSNINNLKKIKSNSEEKKSIPKNKVNINFEEKFEQFDKEFDKLLPKKEIIDDELLDEIDSLSLDRTQKIDITDIPNLDDVELPKIKSLTQEEQDVWKF